MKCYDLSKIMLLAQGKEEFVNTLLHTFLEQSKLSISKMEQSICEGNFYNLSREAHKLRPSLDLFGVQKALEHVRVLEKIEEQTETINAEEVLYELKKILLEAFNALKAETL